MKCPPQRAFANSTLHFAPLLPNTQLQDFGLDQLINDILAKFLVAARVLDGVGLAQRVFLERLEILLARFNGGSSNRNA